MARNGRKFGDLPEIDPSKKYRSTFNITSEMKRYVASVAAINGVGESDVVLTALRILRGLTEMGVVRSFTVEPIRENEIPVRHVLQLDLSGGVSSIEAYDALRIGREEVSSEPYAIND